MSFHYALLRQKDPIIETPEYWLIQAYPEESKEKGGLVYGVDTYFEADSPEGVIKQLEVAIEDIKKYGVIKDD